MGESRSLVGYARNELNTSITRYVPPELVKRMCHEHVASLLRLGEGHIVKKLNPSVLQRRLRFAWWLEYEKAMSNSSTAPVGIQFLRQVAMGVAPLEYLLEQLESDTFLSYMMCPPQEYMVAIEESLSCAIEKLREILDLPLTRVKVNKNGEAMLDGNGNPISYVDSTVVNSIIKVYKMLDDRVKGSIPQSINVKGVIRRDHGRASAGSTPIDASYSTLSVSDLQKKLDILEGTVSRDTTNDIKSIATGILTSIL